MISLATAHPAKFPLAVAAATGSEPPVPQVIARQQRLPERVTVLPSDTNKIAAFITARAKGTKS